MTIEISNQKLAYAGVSVLIIVLAYFGIKACSSNDYESKVVELKNRMYTTFYLSEIICSTNSTAWSEFIFEDKDYINPKTGKRAKWYEEDFVHCDNFSDMVRQNINYEKRAGVIDELTAQYDTVKMIMKDISPAPSKYNEQHKTITEMYKLVGSIYSAATSPDGNLQSYNMNCNEIDTKFKELLSQSDIELRLADTNTDSLQRNVFIEYQSKHIAYSLKSETEELKKQTEELEQYAQNKKDCIAFLKANKKKAGVVTTESGLQYKIIKAGNGKMPKENSNVKVHYEGRLIDGTVFDSSYERDMPFEVDLGQPRVIPGWVEALRLMDEGAEWEIYLPCELAYNDQNMGQIKPYSTLIFKIKVLKIK